MYQTDDFAVCPEEDDDCLTCVQLHEDTCPLILSLCSGNAMLTVESLRIVGCPMFKGKHFNLKRIK
jgi:hypothetical protein